MEIFPSGKMQPAVNAIPWLYKGESGFFRFARLFPCLVFFFVSTRGQAALFKKRSIGAASAGG